MTPDEQVQALAQRVRALETRCSVFAQLFAGAVLGLLAALVGVIWFGRALGVPHSTSNLTAHEIVLTDKKGQPVGRLKGMEMGVLQLTRPGDATSSEGAISIFVGRPETGFLLFNKG